MLASAESDTVDPPKETVAESAERMSSVPVGLAFSQYALDFHKATSLAAEFAEAAEVAEAQSAAGNPRNLKERCLSSSLRFWLDA